MADHVEVRVEGRPLPRVVWLLSGVSFLADVSSEMAYPLVPLLVVGTLGGSAATLGAIEGAAVLVVAGMSATAGWRSDVAGSRVPWVRWGYGLPVLGRILMAAATGPWMVLVGRLVDRTGKGLRGAPRDALLAGAVDDDLRGRAFGLHRALDTAGALLGVGLSAVALWALAGAPAGAEGGAVSEAALRSVLGLAAAAGLGAFGLTWLLHEPEASHPVAVAPFEPSNAAEPLPRAYWASLAALVAFAFANSTDAFLLLRAADLGLAPWAVVVAYALYNAVYAAVSYPAGALSDRFGRWGVLTVGWVIYVGVYAGFAVTPAWGVWPLFGAYGVYAGLTDGVGKALVADHAPKSRRGSALGLLAATTGLATFTGSLIGGALWDQSGPTATFALGAIAAAVALLLVPFARRAAAR